MYDNYETVIVDKQASGAVWLTLNRPQKKNAMNPVMHREMAQLLDDLAYDQDVRVLVITGAGDSFCAGQDLKERFLDLADDPMAAERVQKASLWRSHQLRLFPRPTIAAVTGWCFGGAFTIVASCDIVVTADEARYGLSEINFGKIPGGYVGKSIMEVMSRRDAFYYSLTGESFDGKRAAEMKLATKSVPLAELHDVVTELANVLAQKNPHVARATKEALSHVADMSFEQAGAWLKAKSEALDHASGTAWKTGATKFKEGAFKPGQESYVWK
jgi:trans-feruloyl-CoA hydratase/vanillin synthase